MSRKHTEQMRAEMTPTERAAEEGKLRDEFAKEATHAILTNPANTGMTCIGLAALVYEIADEMLKARLK